MSSSSVNVFYEWGQLEEVIIGNSDFACSPRYEFLHTFQELIYGYNNPDDLLFKANYYPKDLIESSSKEIENLISILKQHGVKRIQKCDSVDWKNSFYNYNFKSPVGGSSLRPRDLVTVVGQDEILKTFSGFRYRYYEHYAVNKLLNPYIEKKVRIETSPQPLLNDDLYYDAVELEHLIPNKYVTLTEEPKVKWIKEIQHTTHRHKLSGFIESSKTEYDPIAKRKEWTEEGKFGLKESDPILEAQDIVKLGKDIFIQKSNFTNDFGIQWFTSHIKDYYGDKYSIHKIQLENPYGLHLSKLFLPLKPGILLCASSFLGESKKYKQMFEQSGWKILSPPSTSESKMTNSYYGNTLEVRGNNMNILSINENTVIVPAEEPKMAEFLKSLGLQVIPVEMKNTMKLGSGIKDLVVDLKRKGTMKSFLNCN